MKQKLFLNILVCLLCVGGNSLNAQMSGSCGNSLTWSITGETLTISGAGEMTNYERYPSVNVSPWSSYSDITNIIVTEGVTSIGNNAFENYSSIISITIPNSLKIIGERSFYNCENLISVTIGNGLASIGNYAFAYCKGIASMIIPDKTTDIGEYAFYACKNLSSVTIGNHVANIGPWAFSYCTSLSSIVLPGSVTNMGNSIFNDCSNLISVTFEEGITAIGQIFYGCSNLLNISVPNSMRKVDQNAFTYTKWYQNTDNGVVYIGNVLYKYKGEMPANTSVDILEGTVCIADYAFSGGWDNLISVTLPASLKSIGDYAFANRFSVKSITIPNGLESIGSYAFHSCGLTSIHIPASVTSIGSNAFSDCNSLTSFSIDGSNTAYCSIDGVLYNKDQTELIFCPKNISGSISIPAGVTIIKDYAFDGCSLLTSISIPDNVAKIGAGAFANCSALSSIAIPSKVTDIEEYTFLRCASLTSITIQESVTNINLNAFTECSSLTEFTVSERNQNYASVEGVLLDKQQTAIIKYPPLKPTQIYSIPNTVTGIGGGVFAGCINLVSVNIPNGVVSIGTWVFNGCTNLSSINIPESVISIGEGAFANCESLTAIVIPQGLNVIEDYTFYGAAIKSVIIPEGVTSIGKDAFYACKMESISIPSTVVSIGTRAFMYCSYLSSITNMNPSPQGLPVSYYGETVFGGTFLNKITLSVPACAIGVYQNTDTWKRMGYIVGVESPYCTWNIGFPDAESVKASMKSDTLFIRGNGLMKDFEFGQTPWFADNTRIKSIVMEGEITNIGSYAFYDCGFTSVTIPESVTVIGSGAFNNCVKMSFINIQDRITTINDFAFNYCQSLTSITIPASVTTIGNCAFRYCGALISVVNLSSFPQNINRNVFDGINLENITLYVPESAMAQYQNADVWKEFGRIISFESYLGVDKEIIIVPTDGGNLPVFITSAEKTWTIHSDADWLHLSTTTGTGRNAVVITALPNMLTPRDAAVTIETDNNIKTISIYQGANMGNNLYLPDSYTDPSSALVEYKANTSQWDNLTTMSYIKELRDVSNLVYSKFKDDFDFIFFVLNTPEDTEILSRLGFYGTHLSGGSEWGSEGNLKFAIYFPYCSAVVHGPSLHEICHHWANSLISTSNGSHWGISNAGGQLGGFRYIRTVEENSGGIAGNTKYQASFLSPETNSDGSFKYGGFGENANGGNSIPYSDIELFMMGMKSDQELRDNNFRLDVYNGISYDEELYYTKGYFCSTGINSYSVDDIMAMDGFNYQDISTSQKQFKGLTVVLTRDSYTDNYSRDIARDVNWLAGPIDDQTYKDLFNFRQATNNIGSLTVDDIKSSAKFPVSSISLNKTELTLVVGKEETLVATILPDDAAVGGIKWESWAPSIVTVENGKIRAITPGTTYVLASIVDKDGNDLYAYCFVTVIGSGSGIENTLYREAITIFPNPARDELHIRSEQPVEKIEIYDLMGRRKMNSNPQGNESVNISSLPAGVYIVRIHTSEGVAERKLVKE